jgi:integrase
MELNRFQPELAGHVRAFCKKNPDLVTWSEEFSKLIQRYAAQNKFHQNGMVQVPPKKVDNLVRRLLGGKPAGPKAIEKFKRLDGLLTRLNAAGIALVPSPVPPVQVKRDYCISFASDDVLFVASFEKLWSLFLFADLMSHANFKSKLNKAGLREEDHWACSALFALVGAADLLVQSPAHALANFSVEQMDLNQPWTITSWYKRKAYRWPVSSGSAIYLLRLLSLIPKRFRKHPYFFGQRFFKENTSSDSRVSPRIPVRTRSGAILLHKAFNTWLRCLTHMAKTKGSDIPVSLTLKTAIKAARIRAAMVFAPAVVSYLSGKFPSPPLDEFAWQSIHRGTAENIDAWDEPQADEDINPAHTHKLISKVTAADQERADRYYRQVELMLKSGHAKKRSYQDISKSVMELAEQLPLIPVKDGKQSFLGIVRAALFYLALRVGQPKVTLETLLGDLKWLEEICIGLFGARSLCALSAQELTDIVSRYMRYTGSPQSQIKRRTFLKRFLSSVHMMSKRVLVPGATIALPNWRDPELTINWNRKPRRILTPRHLKQLIGDVTNRDEKLRLKLIASLAFYCGMRRGEILALTNENYKEGLSSDLELSYSKTRSGIRRLPISVLIPESYSQHVRESFREATTGQRSQPLIKDGVKSLRKLERRLSKRFAASPHTLRHSAASMMVLKLCLAQNLVDGQPVSSGLERFREHLAKTQGEEFSRNSILAFAEGLLGPGWRQSWRMTIPVVSKILGHLEPTVTVQVYLHVIEVIASHTRDLFQWPDMSQVQAAAMSKTSRTTLIKHWGISGGDLYTAEEVAVYMATRHLPSDLFECKVTRSMQTP